MIGKMIGSGITALVAILFIVLGIMIWKKERIELLHEYHMKRVPPKDKAPFCTLSGIGILIIGISLLLTAIILWITDSALSFILFAIGFAVGLTMLIMAGLKYNRN